MRCLRDFQANAEEEVEKLMQYALNEARRLTKEQLRSMANPDANLTMPYGGKVSKPIHVRVAENLNYTKTGPMEFTFYAAESEERKEQGVLGRRGGKLAHIVAKGMDPFRYGQLPPLVWSSLPFYAETGKNRESSHPMRMRVYHPGFYRTFDFIAFAQQILLERLKSQSEDHLTGVGVRAGFSATAAGSMAAGKRVFTKNTVGGRGIMRARGA